MKSYKTHIYTFLFIGYLFMSVFSFGIFKTDTVYAVPAGCYFGEGNGANTYASTQCPNESVARAVSQFQACFVVLPGGTYEERNCDRLEEVANEVPEGTTFTSGPIETDCEPPEGEALSRANCGIINLLVIGINFLSAVAGIAIIASLMIAGFQYMTAQDDSGKIQKAKSRIIQTLVALTLFIFMYAFLNYLVPGGVIP